MYINIPAFINYYIQYRVYLIFNLMIALLGSLLGLECDISGVLVGSVVNLAT